MLIFLSQNLSVKHECLGDSPTSVNRYSFFSRGNLIVPSSRHKGIHNLLLSSQAHFGLRPAFTSTFDASL